MRGQWQPRGHRNFLVASVVGLLALAAVVGWPYLLLALHWVLALMLGFLMARRAVAPLTVVRSAQPGGFEDEEVTVELVLRNGGFWPRSRIEVVDHFGPSLGAARTLSQTEPLRGRQQRRLTYEAIASQMWGIYPVGPTEIATSDAMGLFRASKTMDDVRAFSLFPQVHRVEGLDRLGDRPSLARLSDTMPRRGTGELYLGVREWVTGDDPRRIHWPATARTGQPMVREQELDRVPYFTLFLDLHRDHRAGFGRKSTLEYVVRIGASLLATTARAGHYVQMLTNRARPLLVPPGRGEGHLEAALEAVVRLKQDASLPLQTVLVDRLGDVPPGSTAAILLSTAVPETAAVVTMLESLQRRQVRASFVLVDHHSFVALEKRPPDRAFLAQRAAELRAVLAAAGAPLAVVTADEDLRQRLGEGLFRP